MHAFQQNFFEQSFRRLLGFERGEVERIRSRARTSLGRRRCRIVRFINQEPLCILGILSLPTHRRWVYQCWSRVKRKRRKRELSLNLVLLDGGRRRGDIAPAHRVVTQEEGHLKKRQGEGLLVTCPIKGKNDPLTMKAAPTSAQTTTQT